MQIRLATSLDLQPLSHLFDEYRQSLGQEANYQGCETFLSSRLAENDSMLFVAFDRINMVGFIQLYPSFTSLLLKPIWNLDDAYVVPECRSKGIATMMIDKAKALANSTGVMFISRNDVVADDRLEMA